MKHYESCFLNNGERCPAAFDAYGTKRQCLVAAIMLDDENELLRKERGYPFHERWLTTEDGYWLPEEETIRLRHLPDTYYQDLRREGLLLPYPYLGDSPFSL